MLNAYDKKTGELDRTTSDAGNANGAADDIHAQQPAIHPRCRRCRKRTGTSAGGLCDSGSGRRWWRPRWSWWRWRCGTRGRRSACSTGGAGRTTRRRSTRRSRTTVGFRLRNLPAVLPLLARGVARSAGVVAHEIVLNNHPSARSSVADAGIFSNSVNVTETTSSQRSDLIPTSFKTPTCRNPQTSCTRMDPVLLLSPMTAMSCL